MTTLLSIVIYLMQRGVRYNRSERERVFSLSFNFLTNLDRLRHLHCCCQVLARDQGGS